MGLEQDSPTRILTDYEITRALKELPSWRERTGALVCAWTFPDSAEAIDFLAIVAEAAERAGHHPDVDWRFNTIFIRTTSNDVGGEVTRRDVDLATLLEFAAEDSGALAVPHRHQDVNLIITTDEPAKLEQFWIHALGYRTGRSGMLRDPEGRNPGISFQQGLDAEANGLNVERRISHSSLERAQEAFGPAEQLTGSGLVPEDSNHQDADGNRVLFCTEYRQDPPPFQ